VDENVPSEEDREDVKDWLTRPMAAAFDLVLSEYAGYTDEGLLDVTMGRFRQMVAVIQARRNREMKQRQMWDVTLAQMMTQTMCSFLAGLAQSKKQNAQMRRAVDSINMVKAYREATGKKETEKEKEAQLPKTEDVLRLFGAREDGLSGVRG
jgi:hypothetical protein